MAPVNFPGIFTFFGGILLKNSGFMGLKCDLLGFKCDLLDFKFGIIFLFSQMTGFCLPLSSGM